MTVVSVLCVAVAVFDAYEPGVGDQSSIEPGVGDQSSIESSNFM